MKNWEKAEKKVAKTVEGFRVRGSGNGNKKGDIHSSNLCIEMKETGRNYYTLTLALLSKISSEAFKEKRIPVFGIEFSDKSSIFFVKSIYCEVPDNNELDWREIVSIRLRPNDLHRGDLVRTIYGEWKICEEKDLSFIERE